MRVLLSTLAILAIATPAMANDYDRDPEHSLEKSNTVNNAGDRAEDGRAVSGMEPAAGVDRTDRTSDRMMNQEPVTKADSAKKQKMVKKDKKTEYPVYENAEGAQSEPRRTE